MDRAPPPSRRMEALLPLALDGQSRKCEHATDYNHEQLRRWVLPIHMYLCFHPPESAARARARDSADAYANGWRPSTGREPVRLSGSWHIRWHIRGDLRPHLQVPR